MKRYTLQEAAQLLHIGRNTLTRRLCTMQITPKTEEYDKRKRYLTEQEINKIRIKYAPSKKEHSQGRIGADMVQNKRPTRAELEARISELEAQIARILQPISAPILHYDRPNRSPSKKKSIREPLPTNLISLERFCKQHGISVTTVRKAISSKRLPMPVVGEWVQGKASVKLAVDEEMQAAILKLYGNQSFVQELAEIDNPQKVP